MVLEMLGMDSPEKAAQLTMSQVDDRLAGSLRLDINDVVRSVQGLEFVHHPRQDPKSSASWYLGQMNQIIDEAGLYKEFASDGGGRFERRILPAVMHSIRDHERLSAVLDEVCEAKRVRDYPAFKAVFKEVVADCYALSFLYGLVLDPEEGSTYHQDELKGTDDPRATLTCYKCGKPGHFRRECPTWDEVEEILDYRVHDDEHQFEVQWKSVDEDADVSWEPVLRLHQDVPRLVKNFVNTSKVLTMKQRKALKKVLGLSR